MPLTGQDLVPLFVPGTTQLPWPFPAVGDVKVQKDGATFGRSDPPGTLVIVSRQISPTLKVSWTVLAENVSALFEIDACELEHAKTKQWYFRPSVPNLGPEPRKGIVYVPEDAPVLMSVEMGGTASGSVDSLSQWAGGCDPCHVHMYSSATVMGRPEKAQ